MKVERIDIDCEILGRDVLSLYELSASDDLIGGEACYLSIYQPRYVSCRVPMEDLSAIHLLERHGFHLIECQIRSTIRFRREFDVSRYPYRYEQVIDEQVLEEVLEIAGNTVVHDRFTVDPEMSPGISGERYRRYVRKSFENADEEVWRLFDPVSGATLAFRTHRKTAPGEVLLLLGGVHPDYKSLGLGVISSYYCFNQMYRDGIRKATTHISAINYPVFNLEIGNLGFRVLATFAVMRKIYA